MERDRKRSRSALRGQGSAARNKSHAWQAWEDIFAIKQAIETSGYKVRKDMEGVIRVLEGLQMKNSLEVKKRIPKEELAKNMPLRHNLSTLPV